MSTCSSSRVALRGIFAAILCSGLTFANLPTTIAQAPLSRADSGQQRMATFESGGQTSFALSLKADFNNRPQRATDVVIYVDTSASQSGTFRDDSISSLSTLLANLHADDRVKIFAVDLDPVPLTKQFVRPDSQEVATALDKLNQRVPLGSTDLKLMLKTAPDEFQSDAIRNRNVVYIGDGISRAGVLNANVMEGIVDRLVRNRISVSSFAIGPDRNVDLLSTLANHTGGNVFIDTDLNASVTDAATGLGETVHGSVFWPENPSLGDAVVEHFPTNIPPLREDRDSIVVGTLANRDNLNISIDGQLNGDSHSVQWSVQPEPSNEDFSFLPKMLRDARNDHGLMLPTVGSSGLLEYARVLGYKSAALATLGTQAMSLGNYQSAQNLAAAAVIVDPSNTTAHVLAKAASYQLNQNAEDDPFGAGSLFGEEAAEVAAESSPFDSEPTAETAEMPTAEAQSSVFNPIEEAPAEQPVDAPSEPPSVTDPFEAPSIAPEPAPDLQVMPMELQPLPTVTPQVSNDGSLNLIGRPVNQSAVDRLMREEQAPANRMILSEEDRQKVINDKFRKQVAFELKQATRELRNNPGAAIDRLKDMIGVLDNSSDLFPGNRQDLRNRLESALLSSRQRKLEYDEMEAQRRRSVASATARMRELEALERREEQMSRLINRFNSLMDEGNYDAAIAVTQQALEIDPREPAAVVAADSAYITSQLAIREQLRELKHRSFAAAMFEVDKSNIPFPGNPLMEFPNAEEWKRKKLRRQKYQQIRLTGSENDEKILRALELPATLEYDETPWSDIEAELESQYKINIQLTSSARDDSLNEDEPVTVNLRGIRLKNALRLMLKEKNSTFIVKDEVLQIISLDDAEDARYFVTNVYNVGDLVAPRTNPGGGQGGRGGQGGGQGGQGGGGRGGQGGGGGGGGVFCFQENSVSFDAPTSEQQAAVIDANDNSEQATTAPPSVLTLPIKTQQGTASTWSEYFSDVFANPASVRTTVRDLMKQRKTDEIVKVIFAAIENNQRQDWMYEALTLAMQIDARPTSDVERALMSAVDLSANVNDAIYAAQYMAANGMEKRAISLLQSIADANPTRTEPYILGLRAANKIGDVEGIQWATVGILSQEWPDHPEIVKEACYSADSLRLKFQESGQQEELTVYENSLVESKRRDCYAKVSWTGDADLDVFIQEPGGTVCSRMEPRTTSGGVISGDQFSIGADQSGEMAEIYVLPKGFSGDYKLFVKRVWGEVTAGKVTVTIYSHYNSSDQVGETRQLELEDPGMGVAFTLEDGRRTESLEAHTIATTVNKQLTANRSILAQQIEDSYSSLSRRSFEQSERTQRRFDQTNLPLRNRRRSGAVGYQPIVEEFQVGTFMQVNHATTADRLFVMVSVSPTFSDIVDVFTFNTTANADDATGNPGAGGGGLP